MDPKIINTLDFYVAMSPQKAQNLVDLAEGRPIHPSALAALRPLLVQPDSFRLTEYGAVILFRVCAILTNTFVIPGTNLVGVECVALADLNKNSASKAKICKDYKLTSIHLKALRSMVLYPGQAYNSLVGLFTDSVMAHLLALSFVTGNTRRHDGIWPTKKGQELLFHLMSREFNGTRVLA
ncbi:MAG: hypothetical protein WCP34_15975 [Pseudomonadota bacterium]